MNNKTIIAIVIIAVVVLGGYFLLKSPAYKTPAPTTPTSVTTTPTTPTTETPSQETTSSTPTTQTPSGQNVVTYTNSGYSPSTLRVKAGATVVFQNNSSKSMWTASDVHPTHTVYSGTSLSEHCGSSAKTAFDACTGIQSGNSWSFKFDKVGTWKYHNHLSAGDTGTIIVE